MPTPRTTEADLSAGRAAYDRHAWGEAYERLTAADRAGSLDASDLERLAMAAYLSGRPGESDEIGAGDQPGKRAIVQHRYAANTVEPD